MASSLHTMQQLQFTTVLTTRVVAEVECCYWWFLKAQAHISPGSAGVGVDSEDHCLLSAGA